MALSFSVQCQQFAEKIEVNLSTVVRRAAAQLYSDIVQRTPVDTGYCRRNWQVSADSPAEGVIGEPPKKKKGMPKGELEPLYSPEGANTAIPIAKGVTLIWIVNNVVYAEALENGHSKQAPNGMVRIAIAQLQAEWDGIIKGLGA
jgi:Bacteriophage HK97-gp10, putative tail-component